MRLLVVNYLQLMSRTTALVSGGTMLLLLAWQISLACKCWRPTFGNVR